MAQRDHRAIQAAVSFHSREKVSGQLPDAFEPLLLFAQFFFTETAERLRFQALELRPQ